MKKALAALDSARVINYTQTADKYGVDRNTLSRRFKGEQVSRENAAYERSLLSKEQQKTLINYIDKICERGLPPTPFMVRNFAAEICGEWPGKNWVARFTKKHKKVLHAKYLAGHDLSRKKADNYFRIKDYFDRVCTPKRNLFQRVIAQ